MDASAQTKLTPLRRLLSVVPVLILAVIVVNAVGSGRMAPRSLAVSDVPFTSPASAASLAPPESAVSAATVSRELVAMEAAGLVTLARPSGAAMPHELVAMEAAGLVTLARPLPNPQLRPAWQGDAGYHVWGDCTDPFARQAAPELCGWG